jgi:hypothetical protein
MKLDEIEARANAATPGPWYVVENDPPLEYWAVNAPCGREVFDDGSAAGEYGASCSIADRDFLAAARADVPALIARVRELEAELEEVSRDRDAQQRRAFGLYGTSMALQSRAKIAEDERDEARAQLAAELEEKQ